MSLWCHFHLQVEEFVETPWLRERENLQDISSIFKHKILSDYNEDLPGTLLEQEVIMHWLTGTPRPSHE